MHIVIGPYLCTIYEPTMKPHMYKIILNRAAKLTICGNIIRPVVTSGCATWVIKKKEAEKVKSIERKILRKAFGPVRDSGQ